MPTEICILTTHATNTTRAPITQEVVVMPSLSAKVPLSFALAHYDYSTLPMLTAFAAAMCWCKHDRGCYCWLQALPLTHTALEDWADAGPRQSGTGSRREGCHGQPDTLLRYYYLPPNSHCYSEPLHAAAALLKVCISEAAN